MNELIERLNATGKWWMIGKGEAKPGEPLWGCIIQQPRINGPSIAKAEGDDLAECIERALADVEKTSASQ